MQLEPKIDLSFHVLGQKLPVDHGFALYGAVSRIVPLMHEDQDVGLKLIRGRYIGEGMLDISPSSELVLRLPVSRIGHYIHLAGKTLEIAGERLTVGIPGTKALIPAATLYAQLVTTRNGHEQTRFEAELRTRMDKMNLRGELTVGKRRTLRIHGKQVVGYALKLSRLTAEESITVQEKGLGGRRKMGCGFFEAWRQEVG